jgi:hypothetical protein
MNKPILVIGESVRKYPQFRLKRFQIEDIQSYCVKKLELKDLGQLRDKYDGQTYMDKIIRKIGAHFAVLDYLDKPLPKLDYNFIDRYKPIIQWDDDIMVVATFDSETYPSLSTNEIKKPRIFVYDMGEFKYSLCGIADVELLNNNDNYRQINAQLRGFTSLDKLEFPVLD